jgi:hypothetical protein
LHHTQKLHPIYGGSLRALFDFSFWHRVIQKHYPVIRWIHWQSTCDEVCAIFGQRFVMQSGTADLHSNER